ncbi:MAG: hypothetical protein WDO16_18580 [Bacteroidota bacterium]
MNRRNFLQKGSLAAATVFILPKGIKQDNKPSVYTSTAQSVDADTHVFYKLSVYHTAIQNLKAAADNEKIITLGAQTTAATDPEIIKESSEFKYKITDSKLVNAEEGQWQVKAKADSKTGGFKLPEDLGKKMNLACTLNVSASIDSKKDYPLVVLTYHDPSDDDGMCFLTTACVHHKGLPDNCEELTTLRFLRDGYMTADAEGRQLIKEYRITGPAIIHAVNRFSNKADIYEYMYNHLVQPSVQFVQHGRYAEAVDHYKSFVQAIQKEYCQE